jgi:NAD-dependent dihydropyrimidine dehydrogenase PreA subunit
VIYVITDPCIGEKSASCVEVCPVDCIHSDEDSSMNYIDPAECIGCGACVDPCPVSAIYRIDMLPPDQEEYVAINAEYFAARD